MKNFNDLIQEIECTDDEFNMWFNNDKKLLVRLMNKEGLNLIVYTIYTDDKPYTFS